MCLNFEICVVMVHIMYYMYIMTMLQKLQILATKEEQQALYFGLNSKQTTSDAKTKRRTNLDIFLVQIWDFSGGPEIFPEALRYSQIV